MKYYLLLLFISFSSYAVELKFVGPCDENFIMRVQVSENFQNVGELTIETLKKFSIPHQGTYEGLASAFETPIGPRSIEVLSENESRYYGWCFAIDGYAPELYPHEVPVNAETRSVVWTFGFAHYLNGQWVTQCTPAYKVKPKFLCQD